MHQPGDMHKKGGSAELPPEVSPLPDPLKVAQTVCGQHLGSVVVIDTESTDL
jgi:hypothetical protein